MTLTDMQKELSSLLYEPGDRRVFLAGAGGLILHNLIERGTDDLDGFIHSTDDFVRIADESEALLRGAGYVLEKHPESRDDADSSQIRTWMVSRPDFAEHTKIQFVRDYIVLPPTESAHGLTLDPIELAANKVMVIYQMGRARDYADLAYSLRNLDFNEVLAVADQKEVTPLDKGVLAWGFRSIDRIPTAQIVERYVRADVAAIRVWAHGVADALEQGTDPGAVPLPPLPGSAVFDPDAPIMLADLAARFASETPVPGVNLYCEPGVDGGVFVGGWEPLPESIASLGAASWDEDTVERANEVLRGRGITAVIRVESGEVGIGSGMELPGDEVVVPSELPDRIQRERGLADADWEFIANDMQMRLTHHNAAPDSVMGQRIREVYNPERDRFSPDIR